MKTQEKTVQTNRRHLLKMIAGGTASAPILSAGLLSASAGFANATGAVTPVKNVIFVFIPGGAPGGASTTITPGAGLQLKACSAPLEPVKQECVFFANTTVQGSSGHGLSQTTLGALTGAPKTIDLALGDVLGGTTPFSSIQLGVLSADTSISAVNNWAKVPVITDPSRVFEILRDVQVSTNPQYQHQYKQLEINLKAVQQLQQQLGGFAGSRLQANLDAIRRLQEDVSSSSGLPGCDLQHLAWPAESIPPNSGAHFTRLWELQTSNAITAIKCGLTRVVTMLMGNEQDDFSVTGLDHTYGMAANGMPLSAYVEFRKYLTARLTHVIQQLQNTTDINGVPLLDSTLVVQVTNMGDTSININTDAPFMFAGGGASIRRGQVATAPLHTQVLDTVALAMGVYGTIAPYSATGSIAGVVV
ncbi:MAG TPA: DUF1552 domain-containing protein [Cellvibrio sp.]|nr:DUF1552 domain-containing protein [Cellvibrio sp.]